MKTIAIIPARAGSKGISDKNIRSVGGRILIDWSIRCAKHALLDILVSTDSAKYVDIVNAMYPKEKLCPFVRPKKLAKDDTPTTGVILHALDWLEENCKGKYDTFILLEPTAPLRKTEDITKSIAMMRDNQSIKAVVSVCDSHRMHPAVSFRVNRGYLQPNTDMPHLQRQSLEPFYHLTGTIYMANIEFYRQHKTFITPETRVHIVEERQDLELDVPSDILLMECRIKEFVREGLM
jgi:CMP-N-acetylneuraminic acid synthetase